MSLTNLKNLRNNQSISLNERNFNFVHVLSMQAPPKKNYNFNDRNLFIRELLRTYVMPPYRQFQFSHLPSELLVFSIAFVISKLSSFILNHFKLHQKSYFQKMPRMCLDMKRHKNLKIFFHDQIIFLHSYEQLLKIRHTSFLG